MGNFDNPLYNFPLEHILEALGAKKGSTKDMWFSPFRDEKEASLHINPAKNVWYDFGTGMGGTNVQLVMIVRRCGQKEAEKFIANLDPSLVPPETTIKAEPRQGIEIKRIREIQCDYLKRYLRERKIPLELAQLYLKEVLVYSPLKEHNFTLVGFPNNPGGFVMRSPIGTFKSTTKAGITTINPEGDVSVKPQSSHVAIFEGFFDFLSWQVMQSTMKPSCDVVVLNSVTNLEKARAYITAHRHAVCFLDNDDAGRKCTDAVKRMMHGKEVTDMSDLYRSYKDLNEMLQHARGYSSNMRLYNGI